MKRSRRRLFEAGIVATLLVAELALAPTEHVSAVAGDYHPVIPARLLDTRPGQLTADGSSSGGGLRPFDSTLVLQVGGRGGVPTGASAVVLNVTVAEAQGDGFVTVYPCDAARPTASNLNYLAGQTVPNLVVSRLSAQGTVCLYTLGPTHLIADVTGYFATSSSYSPLTAPARLLDTRAGFPTIDGAFAGTGAVAAGSVQQLLVAGRGGTPFGVASVVLNVTATSARSDGFVTVYPCDASRPNASNLNFVSDQTVPNVVVVRVPANGVICLFTSATVDLVVDISGYFTDASTMVPLVVPGRLVDTRPGGVTADGQYAGTGLRPTGGTLELTIGGRMGVPTSASAVILNVTATEPRAPGFLTAYPRGSARPLASNVNFEAGQTVANAVIAPLGFAGTICLFNNAATHIVVDVTGYIAGPAPTPETMTMCPLDTGGAPPPTPLPPSTPVPPPGNSYPPGQYLVNHTLPPGRYAMPAASAGCYWERQSGLSGSLDDVLANDFQPYDARVIVDILSTDVGFELSSECGNLTSYWSIPSVMRPSFGAGAYVIGTDVQSGTYSAIAAYGCYWERRSSFTGELDAIIANDFIDTPGPIYVTITSGDTGFYTTDDCGIWTLV